MRALKNLFALIGLVTAVGGSVLLYNLWTVTKNFDPNAFNLYQEFAGKLLETGDLADAFVWAVPVDEGISLQDIMDSMRSLATENNFLFVGESPFYKQVEAVSGQAYRKVVFVQFCDVQVGMKMLAHNNAYSAFMPCVISVVEDTEGRFWLYAMNMDFLIHGANELPTELKTEALKVRRIMRVIMEGAAKGEF